MSCTKPFITTPFFCCPFLAEVFDAIQPTQYVTPIETGAFNASLFARLVMLEESEKNDDRNRHA